MAGRSGDGDSLPGRWLARSVRVFRWAFRSDGVSRGPRPLEASRSGAGADPPLFCDSDSEGMGDIASPRFGHADFGDLDGRAVGSPRASELTPAVLASVDGSLGQPPRQLSLWDCAPAAVCS